MKVKTKLLVFPICGAGAIGILLLLVIYGFTTLVQREKAIYSGNVLVMEKVLFISETSNRASNLIPKLAIDNMMGVDKKKMSGRVDACKAMLDSSRIYLQELLKNNSTDAEIKNLLSRVDSLYPVFKKKFDELSGVCVTGDAYSAFEIMPAFSTISEQVAHQFERASARSSQATREAFAASSQQTSLILKILSLIALLFIGILVILSLLFGKSIITPLKEMIDHVKKVTQGDLTQTTVVVRDDEIGEFGSVFKTMQDHLRSFIGTITNSSSTVQQSSEELSHSSEQLVLKTTEVSNQTNRATESTCVAKESVQHIAEAAEEMSLMVASVSSAIEQMSATIDDVTKASSGSLTVAQRADAAASETTSTIKRLEDATAAIEKVITVIHDISDKVNLLALNATIEAASAGDAGKGFAVVAHEVKDLAKQTAIAAEEIGEQIHAIQIDSKNATAAVGVISTIVSEFNAASRSINQSIEEQSSAVNEIAKKCRWC